jgi:hypothetical protein
LGLGLFGHPSTALHDTHRWFVTTRVIPDSFYPDGVQRSEVFACRDDYQFELNNTPETRVQLTDEVTLQPAVGSTIWVPGDQKISFRGRRWSSAAPGATIVEGGLYTATLAFGANGSIIGLAAQPMAPALDFPLGGDQWPSFGAFAWHPDGNRLAYVSSGLWTADLATGSRTRIYAASVGHPQFAPDGTKIAFTNGSLGISTIKLNGTGLKEIIRRTSQWSFVMPVWSPGGTHIACTGQAMTGSHNLEVFRANSNGNSLTNLSNTPYPFDEWPLGWR